MEATFKELLDLCKEHGFDAIITAFDKILKENENMQAYLFGVIIANNSKLRKCQSKLLNKQKQ